MFLSLFLTCFVALLVTTGLLLAFGHRVACVRQVVGVAEPGWIMTRLKAKVMGVVRP